MSKHMRVLVTGGTGYIGSHVVLYLLKNNHQVMVYDNLSNSNTSTIVQGAEFVQNDILNADAFEKVTKTFRPHAIIHLAALKSTERSLSHSMEYSDVNITGSINVLNSAVRNNVSYFVFSSSASIFGIPQYLPIDEAHIKEPISYYGETKLMIEKILRWYSKSYPLYYSSLRYFNAAGHELDAPFSAIEKKTENLIPIILETALGKKKQLKIFGNDYATLDGTCIRDYIHVSDLAEAHILSLRYLERKKESIELNLGTSKGFSNKEIYAAAQRVTKRDIPMVYAERRKGDSESLYAKSVLAQKKLSWIPKYTNIEDIIMHAWVHYQKHQETSQ